MKKIIIVLVLIHSLVSAEYKYEVLIQAQKEIDRSVFSQETIAVSNSSDLASVLQSKTHIGIYQYGTWGSQASAGINGSSSSQVLFAVEEVPVNSAQSGFFDLSLFPSGAFHNISFIKGGISSVYGANASSGYVNLQFPNSEKHYLKTKILSGSFNTYAVNLFYAVPLSRHIYVNENIYTGYAENNYPFTNSGIRSIRSNSRYQHVNSVTVFHYKTSGLNSHFSILYNNKTIGVPGPGIPQNPDAEQNDNNLLLISKTKFFIPFFTEILLSYYASSLHYTDPSYLFGPAVDSLHKNQQFFTKIYQSAEWRFINFFYGFEEKYNTIHSSDIGLREKNLLSQFSSINLYLLHNALKTAFRYRYEYSSVYYHILTYNAGYNISLPLKFILWGNTGTAFREPAFNDLYWQDDGTAKGNPDLQPEFSHNWELGFENNLFSGLSIKGNYFENFYTNIIAWTPDADGKWTPQNIRRALYYGADFTSSLSAEHYDIQFYFKKLYPVILSHDRYYGKFIPYQPFDRFGGTVRIRYANITLSGEYHYTGFSYKTANNTVSSETLNDEYDIINMSLAVHLQALYIKLQIKNILNRFYLSQTGYPLPGRQFLCTASYTFQFKGGK